MINAVTILGKVNTLSTTVLSTVTIFLLHKPLNTASFYLVANSLVNNLDTYIEDSDSVIVKLLNIL